MRLHQIVDGEWVTPVHRGYRLRCCQCGLTHRMNFRVAGKKVQFQAVRVKSRKK